MKKDLLTIIKYYGIENQLKYIHSEYFELDEAILEKEKVGAYPGVEEKKHITEEIADVMVMLKQIQYYYEIPDEEIEYVMKYKIERQLKRMEEKE